MSLSQLSTALEATRTAVCVLAADGGVEYASPLWESLVGEHDELVRRVAAPGLERVPLVVPDGRHFAVSAAAGEDGTTVIGVDDVTAEAAERAARSRFLAEVVRAQELEARRVAELLHDDVVQRLTALGLRLELAALRSGDEGLAALGREAGDITTAIRRLLVELHPAVLESQGLAAAVDVAADALRSLGIEVEVARVEARAPADLEQLAYRVVQEALANVIEHAEATRVTVALELDERRLRCDVLDDGCGIGPAVPGLGLELARERVGLAGGRFDVGPLPEGGTAVRFELPLHATAEART